MKRSRSYRPVCEALEIRSMLATVGVPWGNPMHLTLSFPPDGTQIAGHTSNLATDLNAALPNVDWRRILLHAAQIWAVRANLNIGVVDDGGQAFGVPGRTQGDTRFGDIRIGDQAMSAEVSAVSVLHDPFLSGTLAGDVFLNSQTQFTAESLAAVALHEFGHTLGLDENDDPSSVMYSQYNGQSALSAGDIARLQALYGKRAADLGEGSDGNNSISRATHIQYSDGYDDSTPLAVWGDISNSTDLDYFALKTQSDDGPITIRLQTRGISLLAPRLTLFDANGELVANAASTNPSGDVVRLTLPHPTANATYYLRVMSATSSVFRVGSYAMAVTYDDSLDVDEDTIDARLSDGLEGLNADDVDEIFRDPAASFQNEDFGENEDFLEATTLQTTPGYVEKTHYEAVGSISSTTDVDVFRIKAADVPSGSNVMTVTGLASPVHGTIPTIRLFDGDMHAVKGTILANGNGIYTIQAAGLKSGADYFVRVLSSHSRVGNYSLTVEFGHRVAVLETFAAGTLNAGRVSAFNFYVAQSQLMSLILTARAATRGGALKMEVFDSTGLLVYSLSAGANNTVSGPSPFFTPGIYTVRFHNSGSAPLAYSLRGTNISDPIGPIVSDPTTAPRFVAPTAPLLFTYPDGTTTSTPYYWGPAPNTPPTNLVLTAGAVQANGVLTLTGRFTDPDSLDLHKVYITWGSEGTTVLSLAAGVTTFSAAHVVQASGSLTVSVMVTDLRNGSVSKSVIASRT